MPKKNQNVKFWKYIRKNIQLVAKVLSLPLSSFFTIGYEQKVAETPPLYAPIPAEEKTLLKHFRRIKEKNDKLLVINIARLAARKP